MKAVGIIVEYNPFHNGHQYHIEQAKEVTGADCVIAVMSGNFLQRGEPALVSKFSRTKMALAGGCDLVVELPYAFASQQAEVFAKGAVEILSSLNSDFLVFGSESGDTNKFKHTLKFLTTHQEKINTSIQTYLKEGMSYPKAYATAVLSIQSKDEFIDISQPNNMLGVNYIKAIISSHSKMIPRTIKRQGSGYHDEKLSETKFSSATGIRKALLRQSGCLDSIQPYIPESTLKELQIFKEEYQNFGHWENYWPYLKYQILSKTASQLRDIYEMEEGLEYRLLAIAKSATNFRGFMEQLKTKRYTWTRLQRVLVHVLTNTRKDEMLSRCAHAEYIRLLGTSEKGRRYLKLNREQISLPLISKISQANPKNIHLDLKASSVYSFGFGVEIGQKLIDAEIKQPPILV